MQITAPGNATVLFNTDVVASSGAGGGMRRHTFATTPPIATYLLAIVAGDLAHQEVRVPHRAGSDARPLRVRAWGRPSVKASLALAAHTAAAAAQGAPRLAHPLLGSTVPLVLAELASGCLCWCLCLAHIQSCMQRRFTAPAACPTV